MRSDREIVLTAVSQNGRVLAFASDELCADREVCTCAVDDASSAVANGGF